MATVVSYTLHAVGQAREGALFAFECLVERLGRLFEPYVIAILPKLLVAFGDGDAGVREATDGASRAIMAQLSGHGVHNSFRDQWHIL